MNIVASGIRGSLLGLAIAAGALASAAWVEPARAAGCPISGPSRVAVNESFTLCAAAGSQYTYEWSGAGLSAPARSRCVTVDGNRAGTYEYQVVVRHSGVVRERCVHTVTVGGGGLGSLQCTITGPATIASGTTAQLCAPRSSRHSYQWTGPGGFTGTASCVTVSRPGTYTVRIVNDLTDYVRECSHTLRVTGEDDAQDCTIDGPEVIASGSTARLCAPQVGNAIYLWEGPGGFQATSRCVTVRAAGSYAVTIRHRSTGLETRCTHRLFTDEDQDETCEITGPPSVADGTAAQLCGRTYANSTYGWSGPLGFRSSMRCVSVRTPGVYTLVVRNRSTGELRECSFTLEDEDADDGDAIVSDNCPRAVAFWQRQCVRTATNRPFAPNDFTVAELRSIARRVDERSAYFNWSDDVTGFCTALHPTGPLTQRKNAVRNYAALLANIGAGELGITTRSGDVVALDPDTDGTFGASSTVGELAAQADRVLTAGRGSFVRLNQYLGAVNRGRGIGPVCQ